MHVADELGFAFTLLRRGHAIGANIDDNGARAEPIATHHLRAADSGDEGAADTTLGAGDAVLIPPSGATSPTSGPPNTDPLASASPPAAATCEGRSAGPDRVADDLDLRVQLGATLETGRVRWALTVTNRGDRPRSLSAC